MMEQYSFNKNGRQIRYFKKQSIILITIILLLVALFAIGLTYVFTLKSKYEACKKKHEKNDDDKKMSINIEKLTMNANEERLPANLIPYYYHLYLITNFSEDVEPLDYNGTVNIYFTCFIETNKILMNAKNLEIYDSSISVSDVADLNINFSFKSVIIEPSKERLIIEFDKNFEKNHNYTVYITFRGFLKDDDHGFFRLSYIDKLGKKR